MLCCGALTGTWGLPCTPFPKILTAGDQSNVNLSHKNSNPESNQESKRAEKEQRPAFFILILDEGGLKRPQLFISLPPDSNLTPFFYPCCQRICPGELPKPVQRISTLDYLPNRFVLLSKKQSSPAYAVLFQRGVAMLSCLTSTSKL